MQEEADIKKTFWPYGLTIYIVLFMITTLSIVIWLSRQQVDLVSDDYYAKEIAYQDQIDRLARTNALASPPALMLTPDNKQLIVRLPEEHRQIPTSGTVYFYRPSDSRMDHKVALSPDENGQQVIDMSRQIAGRWIVKLSWTTNSEDYYYEYSFDNGG